MNVNLALLYEWVDIHLAALRRALGRRERSAPNNPFGLPDTVVHSFSLDVDVTNAHITKGEEDDCFTCPIALAVNDAIADLLPGFHAVADGSHIELHDADGILRYRADTGHEGFEFIYSFDAQLPVSPVSLHFVFARESVPNGCH